jgi:hypothetical protein
LLAAISPQSLVPLDAKCRQNAVDLVDVIAADPYGAHDNFIAGAGYLRELHDRYPVPRFLAERLR